MAAFNGKWKLVSSDNAEAFFDAVKAPEDFKEKVREFAKEQKTDPGTYQEELKVDLAAKTIERIVYIKGNPFKETGQANFGQEYEGKVHGKPAKITATLESDTRIVRKEVGEDFTSTSVLESTGDELTITMTCNGVMIKSRFQRV